MTYSLRFLPEVEEDVLGGYTWYEEKAVGLGEEFLRIFYAFASEIPRTPLLYPKVHHEFRRREGAHTWPKKRIQRRLAAILASAVQGCS